MKKLLLFLLPLVVSAQVQNIPNTTFPAVRALLNSNFSYLDTNKAALSHVHIIADIAGLQAALDGKADLSGSYSNPSWITGLNWTKVQSPPTFAQTTFATTHQFFTAYNAAGGNFTKAQPACGDLSDSGTGCSGSGVTANQNIRTPGAYFSTGSATTVCANVGYAATITGIKVWSDATVTATVDVKTVAFGSFTGAASASSITASSPATITAGTNASPSISGWTTAIAANTMVCFVPSAITAGSATYFVAQLQIAAN